MDLSIVIPARNEAENIAPLVAEIAAVLDGVVVYEVIYIDDGSSDATAATVQGIAATHPSVRLLRHDRSYGQSAAVRSGVRAARAAWIATLDGDGQNDPGDIPRLWAMTREAGSERRLIAGRRTKRRDTWVKRVSSRIANRVRAWLLKDATPDTGCGLKLFRRDLYLDLPFFDHMHRYLPALVLREGGTTVSVPVNHRPRSRGVSNYGTLDRLAVAFADLVGVLWLQRRAKNPKLRE
ncbi:MAG: dpm1 [Rhodospirillales bacterium]|jgi:dolichol-phosphate mannosyltransferase|nr:dpm1 [Rhodospirillales bacterium]